MGPRDRDETRILSSIAILSVFVRRIGQSSPIDGKDIGGTSRGGPDAVNHLPDPIVLRLQNVVVDAVNHNHGVFGRADVSCPSHFPSGAGPYQEGACRIWVRIHQSLGRRCRHRRGIREGIIWCRRNGRGLRRNIRRFTGLGEQDLFLQVIGVEDDLVAISRLRDRAFS